MVSIDMPLLRSFGMAVVMAWKVAVAPRRSITFLPTPFQLHFVKVRWNCLAFILYAMDKGKLSSIIPAPGGEIRVWRRFVTITVTVWLALGMYLVIDRWQLTPPATVVMPAWVPFWPGFAVPYVGLLFVSWWLPVAIRDAGRFYACQRAFICGFLLVM